MRIWHNKKLFCLPWSGRTNRTEKSDAFCGPHIAILMGIGPRLQTRSVLPPHQIAGTLPKTSRNARTTLVILHMSPLKRRHVFWNLLTQCTITTICTTCLKHSLSAQISHLYASPHPQNQHRYLVFVKEMYYVVCEAGTDVIDAFTK